LGLAVAVEVRGERAREHPIAIPLALEDRVLPLLRPARGVATGHLAAVLHVRAACVAARHLARVGAARIAASRVPLAAVGDDAVAVVVLAVVANLGRRYAPAPVVDGAVAIVVDAVAARFGLGRLDVVAASPGAGRGALLRPGVAGGRAP